VLGYGPLPTRAHTRRTELGPVQSWHAVHDLRPATFWKRVLELGVIPEYLDSEWSGPRALGLGIIPNTWISVHFRTQQRSEIYSYILLSPTIKVIP